MLELKFVYIVICIVIYIDFNRTMLELKYTFALLNMFESNFNRTMLELKYATYHCTFSRNEL